MSKNALLKVRNLCSGYGSKKILSNISFEIKENEIVGLLGLNGCGKTTLIKAICKIIPSKGEVLIDNEETSKWSVKTFSRNCSLVPQKSGISIDITVLDVVLMGFNPYLSLLGRPTKEMVKKADEIIDLLGLGKLKYSNFITLSEGQKQLVIIARALASDTKILLMDEPESSLDFSVRYDMMGKIENVVKEKNKCALISLHDINLALAFCDKLILIKDGRINSTIDTRNEEMNSIENKLRKIYGSIKLIETTSNTLGGKLLMVKD